MAVESEGCVLSSNGEEQSKIRDKATYTSILITLETQTRARLPIGTYIYIIIQLDAEASLRCFVAI